MFINPGDRDDATVEKTASAAVDVDLLAVSEHHPLEPDDLLAVGELIAGARDHVARLNRRPSPASRLHPIDRRPADQPFLLLAAISLHLDGDHGVGVAPHEVCHRALHSHKPLTVYRP